VTVTGFEFATAGRVMVGPGRAAELPGVVAGLGSRVLVCTGARPERHAGLLTDLGVPTAVFQVAAEPTVDLARAGLAVEDGLAWIRETLALLAVTGLAAFGLRPEHADDVAAKAMTSSSMQGNPVTLSHGELNAIVLQSL
jgi:alcohol dehydrogenase class IV